MVGYSRNVLEQVGWDRKDSEHESCATQIEDRHCTHMVAQGLEPGREKCCNRNLEQPGQSRG